MHVCVYVYIFNPFEFVFVCDEVQVTSIIF